MRFLLGFLFGASYTANRVFRVTFLLLILFIAFCLYQMSKPLGHGRRVAAPSAPAVDPVDSSLAAARTWLGNNCPRKKAFLPEDRRTVRDELLNPETFQR